MLNQRLVYVVVAAWAHDAYPDAREDTREVLLRLATEATEARRRGDRVEAGGCERAREALSTLWAQATDAILNSDTGHPAWDGVADRLSDPDPQRP